MLNLIPVFNLLISILCYGSPSQIVLENHNTVNLRGEISNMTVSRAIKDISLVPGKEVYLYINSGGGSVIAGGKLVDFLKSTDKKVTCIAEVAASMAMIIFQACETRIVQSGSILMQHQAIYGLSPQPQRNQRSLITFFDTMIGHYDDMQAARLGLTTEQFQALIAHDWWILGAEALKYKAADRLSHITCDKDLLRTTETQMLTVLIFELEVVWSRCPLLSEPISIKPISAVDSTEGVTLSEDVMKEVQRKLRGIHEIREITRKK